MSQQPITDLETARRRRLERRRQRAQRPVTHEEILRRNLAERIKHEKLPYHVDLQRLAQTSYEEIHEDDILRLHWFGLYHDKPKVGRFMMRVKIPGGRLTPEQARCIGQVAVDFGRNRLELTTRQDLQIHDIQLPAVPEIFRRFDTVGLTTRGACGDVLRNITSCPVAGISREELFDVWPLIRAAQERFSGKDEFGNLPRKHKWTIGACPWHCNAPEIHDVALQAVVQDGTPGYAVWVGGGLSTVPRVARSLGVFVTHDEALEVLEAVLHIWSTDLKYRLTRAKARFKFLVDDYGVDTVREKIQQRIGRTLTPLQQEPRARGRNSHLGVHPQKQPGLNYVGFPVFPGLLSGEQLLQIADLVERAGGDIRLTREQNLVVGNVPEEKTQELISGMAQAGVSLEGNPLRGQSIGCTGDPYCNYAVGDTKPKLVQLVEALEQRFGNDVAGLHIYLDGCPHSCGQHWVGDIGVQGTTAKTPEGKVPAYDILLRGGLGAQPAIGKAVVRRVPHYELIDTVIRLVDHYLKHRQEGETLQQFFTRLEDQQIQAVAAGQVAA